MRKIQPRVCLLVAGLLMLAFLGIGYADEDESTGSTSKDVLRFRIELKREATSRGTPEETTKTSLKIDALLQGAITLFRLDIPFPDEKTSFDGSPFNPRVGDIKTRVGFRAFRVSDIPLSSFFEVTFPTASPETLGSGKYQISAGLSSSVAVPLPEKMSESHKLFFNALIQQVASVAGDENFKDINYTKFELALKDTWQQKYWMKLAAKPVVDWEQDAKTGAVAELEVGWSINRDWSGSLTGGARLWGEGVPSTYSTRVGFSVAFVF